MFMGRPSTSPLELAVAKYGGYLYAAILLLAAWISHFAVLNNDCFPLRWQADHLSIHNPESFYNGFFPVGYPLLLRLAGYTGNSILALLLIQIILSGFFVPVSFKFLRKYLPVELSSLALIALVFSPQILRAVLSVTPDFFAAFAILLACISFSKGRFGLTGFFIGLGYLQRTHIVVFLIALGIAQLALANEKRFAGTMRIWLTAMPFILVQGFVQIWSGYGFFENEQAFNIWRTMHGMDWNNPPDLQGISSLDLIRREPMLLLTCMGIGILRSAADLLPLAFVMIHAKVCGRNSILPILTAAAFLYIVINTAGGSPRSLIITMPLTVLSWAYIANIVFVRTRLTFTPRLAAWVVCLAIPCAVAVVILSALRSKARVEEYETVEHTLNVASPSDAKRIYMDDFDLYFPNLKYQTPFTSGGWAVIGLPHYLAQHPRIHDTSAQAERDDLKRAGIDRVVFRVPPYDPRGYESIRKDSTLFQLIARTANHEIYRVQ